MRVAGSPTTNFARVAGAGVYRFVAPVGRIRTLPADGMRPWRAAVFSFANLGFGWFNACAHVATRDDLDCAVHLGDVFYGYGPGIGSVANLEHIGRRARQRHRTGEAPCARDPPSSWPCCSPPAARRAPTRCASRRLTLTRSR